MATRKTLVDAKSQHLPDEAWFVTGEPSRGILMLNFWVSAMTADRDESTALAELELRAARARRFYRKSVMNITGTGCSTFGSSMSSFSHSDTDAAETSCWYLTPGVYLGASISQTCSKSMNRRQHTRFATNNYKSILLIHGSFIFHVEGLESLHQLLVNSSIGRS
jgi:hypothetical protein